MGTTRAECDRAIDHRLCGFDVFAAEIAKCERRHSKRFGIVGSSLKRSMCKINPLAARGFPVLRPTIDVELGVDPGGPPERSAMLWVSLNRVPKQVAC